MSEINISPEDQAVFDRLKSTGKITHGLRRVMTQQWNTCVNCNASVVGGRPAFAGYDADGRPLLVGACCASRLQELATPVYPTGALDLSVDEDQPVWRYMDFAKFVALLKQQGLYFPRADTLDDRFEGAVGLARRESDWNNFYLDFFRSAVTTPPPGYPNSDLSEDCIKAEAERLLGELKSASQQARNMVVSCWHANQGESEALWRLYCPPSTAGVSIRTTVGRLWDVTAQDAGAVVGRVHYLDFRSSFARNGNERIFCKRASLRHEHEVRVVLQNDNRNSAMGKILQCDLNALVSEVVVTPFAPAWFAEIVSSVTQRFGYAFEIRRSELIDEPFY
jgi:hypothetical protein